MLLPLRREICSASGRLSKLAHWNSCLEFGDSFVSRQFSTCSRSLFDAEHESLLFGDVIFFCAWLRLMLNFYVGCELLGLLLLFLELRNWIWSLCKLSRATPLFNLLLLSLFEWDSLTSEIGINSTWLRMLRLTTIGTCGYTFDNLTNIYKFF